MSPELESRLNIDVHEAPARSRRRPPARSTVAVNGWRLLPASPEQIKRSSLRRDKVVRWMLALADCVMALAALAVACNSFAEDRMTLATLGVLPILLVINKITGLYDRDQVVLKRSTLDEVPQLIQLAGVFTLSVGIAEPLLIDGELGHGQLVALWATLTLGLTLGRATARRAARAITREERCLVIGDAEHVERIREKIGAANAHARVVATLPLGSDASRVVSGGPGRIRQVVADLDVERIVIAPVSSDQLVLPELIRVAKAAGVRVSVLPRALEAVGSSMDVETLDGLVMLGVRPFGLSRSSRLIKRAFDLAGAFVGILAIAPVLAVIALAIRLDSRGPVFFRQTRVGRAGRHFRICKFRTMVPDAERRKEALIERNEAGDGLFKITDDPRVTRVGRILRRTSLDELPQLFNVLRGEMSLVGPRPLVLDEDAQVLGLDRARLYLTPGMTGPWQVLGSSRIPMQEMVGMDYLYVANWTLWEDVKILLRTCRHVVLGGNR